MIASISAEFSDILRASSFTARSSVTMAAASGLVEEANWPKENSRSKAA